MSRKSQSCTLFTYFGSCFSFCQAPVVCERISAAQAAHFQCTYGSPLSRRKMRTTSVLQHLLANLYSFQTHLSLLKPSPRLNALDTLLLARLLQKLSAMSSFSDCQDNNLYKNNSQPEACPGHVHEERRFHTPILIR
ncbi:hypothetical protein BYT27DRAFT_6335179 [Phlegmacium glaucopus]|nr:hypothetical protein BYT27DRAFT_6335179 [Phlegmacium glaucopus]